MLGVTARVRIKAGKEAEFEALTLELVAATRREPGNLFYGLFRSERLREYVFIERWRDAAAEAQHMNAPHVAALLPRVQPLLDGEVEFGRYEEIPQA